MASIELNNVATVNELHDRTGLYEYNRRRNHLSLDVMTLDNNETMANFCAKNKKVKLLLRLTGNYWHGGDGLKSIDNILFGLTRLVNVFSLVYNFVNMFMALFITTYKNASDRYGSAGIGFAIVVRTFSVLPVQYFNQLRLFKPAHAPETMVLEESAKVASIFGIAVLCTNVLSTSLLAISSVPANAGTLLTEYFLGAYLCFNLFFLVLDIKASLALLDQLHILADNKKLTMDAFTSAKEEIHRRVKESRWASDLIIIPCLASVAAILAIIFFFLDADIRTAVKIEAGAIACLMLKELLFAAAAFVYVSKVNERADELTTKLSRCMWGAYDSAPMLGNYSFTSVDVEKGADGTDGACPPGSSDSAICDGHLVQRKRPTEVAQVHVADAHRMSVCLSSTVEPISFTLLFKRVSWQNVLLSAVGFAITILTAIVKNAAGVSA